MNHLGRTDSNTSKDSNSATNNYTLLIISNLLSHGIAKANSGCLHFDKCSITADKSCINFTAHVIHFQRNNKQKTATSEKTRQ